MLNPAPHHTALVPIRQLEREALEDHLRQAITDAKAKEPHIHQLDDFLLAPGDARGAVHDDLAVFPHTNVLFDSDGSSHYLAKCLGFQALVGLQGAAWYYGYLGYGDQEVPVYYMLYVGTDGQLHGYAPRGGNAINPFTDRPFTFTDDDDRIAQMLGFVGFRSMESAFEDPVIAGMVYDHDRITAAAARDLSYI